MQDTTHLRFLHSLDVNLGSEVPSVKSVFEGYLDPDFVAAEEVDQTETLPVTTALYEISKDGTYMELFGSVSLDWQSLCLSPKQIVRYCQEHPDQRSGEVYGTFFLLEKDGEQFVVDVFVDCGVLDAFVSSFGNDDVWRAHYCHRLVVKQQTS